MKIQTWPTSKPKPYDKNPRVISDDAVAKVAQSLEQFGWQQPIVVDPHGVIVVGHTRLLAAKKLGLPRVPVVVANLTPEQAQAYRIADNRTGEESEWDEALLRGELETLDAADFDLDLTGFDDDQVDRILAGMPLDGSGEPIDQAPAGDADEVPEVDDKRKPRSERGEIYELGTHRLMCGDATSKEDWRALMGSERDDLCFTSPPYGAGNVAKLRDHYVRGKAKRGSFYDEHEDAPDEWLRLMRGWYGCVAPLVESVVCNVQMLADNKRALVEFIHENRERLADIIVWDKVNGAPQMQRNVLTNLYEFMIVLGGNGSRSIPFADFHGSLANVVRMDPRGAKNDHAGEHRAVMPLGLALWAIRDLCPKAKRIIEPFCGTGTTILAAAKCGRRCFAMELSPRYCDVIRIRWTTFAAANGIKPGSGALKERA